MKYLLILLFCMSCVTIPTKPIQPPKKMPNCAEKLDKCIKSYLEYGLNVEDALEICNNIHRECSKDSR